MQLRDFFGTTEFFQKRESNDTLERRITLLDDLAEDRLILHQFTPHAPPLRTLTTHHKSDARRVLGPGSERGPNLDAILFDRVSVEFPDERSEEHTSELQSPYVI